ncbi:hypothetical protein EDB92DRAFT_1830136 [Lactarius akahatsu]|uniref:Cysteine-rich transmembrane domain-containing protein n=1 Tax=Lactarius akahatsu TaxID=416441 RepID=A0AAD4LQF0_9AGAM|nr:hypothetical protein EDB92DRAFT_1830136 [Lactarius akahatsu]
MSNKDYYGSQQTAGYPQQQQQQYYPPSGPPPGQGYYPQQPQQAYQGYSGQPGFQQQAQPQAVYVQQPPPQKDSGFCAACLTGVCLCCCAEGAWRFGYVLRLLWAYEIAQTPRQSFASAFSERARSPPLLYLCFTIIDAALNIFHNDLQVTFSPSPYRVFCEIGD